jgi:two-component system CheB/CheR fusion protein
VAIGASAGGLAPTVELLRDLGPRPGVALVIIHHLDPTHESGLVEILGRATSMPVAAATDGVAIEVDHVYCVPPNAGLLVRRGVLQIVPRVEIGGLHLPIDRFFESLAVDRDGLAVGVVLSGSGFDGTEGIKVIKREGGITLAQDTSAQYGSMPQSAVATGCVDLVLPPAGLAREITRIGAHAPSFARAPLQGTGDPDYQQILSAMRKSSGIDFASYKHSTLRRRLERRLLLRGLTDLPAYLELLRTDPAETAALCEEVLIHVTGFFREPEAFDALRTLVFPKLCQDRPGDAAIRVWVPGCSTGEEVYSIAICLLEFLGDNRGQVPIKIFGTDVSLPIIEKARSGRYPESIERDVSTERLQRFFARTDGGYQIRRDVRDLCVFARHDVTRDPPFSSMDLISCRNLMIYLGPELQDRVIALLHYALKEPGFLALGSSETVRAFAGFAPVDGKNKIYARTSAAPRLPFDFTAPTLPFDLGAATSTAVAIADRVQGSRSAGPSDVSREADRLVLAEFAPPGVVVTGDLAIVQFRGQTGPFLEPTPGVASLDLMRMAREELRLPLRRAIDKARSDQGPVREDGVALVVGDSRRTISLQVIPFAVHATQQRFFLVLFEDVTASGNAAQVTPSAPAPAAGEATDALRQELASTRQYLESVIEQAEATNEELKAANEEIVSSNEELRSTNEELQSAKEELQATNEELRTVNDEMVDRNLEATRLSDDLSNILTSVQIPIVIVGRDLRLRRFTAAAERVFGLHAADLGRPLGGLQTLVTRAAALTQLVPAVIQGLTPAECNVQDGSGRWYCLAVRPYVTVDGRIDGAVIAARDVDAETRGAERLEAARRYAEDIVDTVREGLVVLDTELRLRSTNKSFQRAFRLTPAECEGRRIDELGRAELEAPALRELFDRLASRRAASDLRLELGGATGPARVFLVNARAIEGTELVLVAFEDITEAEQARLAAKQVELRFRDALTGAAEGILMVDGDGRIQFANAMAARLFGYAIEELGGLSVERLVPAKLREVHVGHRKEYSANPAARPMGRQRELIGLRKDGTEFPIEVALSTVSAEGDRSTVLAFITDVTERRKTEHEIREYQDRLQRMAFDAALTEERERRRIAIELHDRIGQDLALAQIKLTSIRQDVTGAPRAAIEGAVELLDQAIGQQRSLIFDLSPPVLYDLGLKEALAWLAEDVEKRHGVRIEVSDDGSEKPLDDATRALVFRAVRELVMNVLKHAHTPVAKVSLTRNGDHFDIQVEDPGVGFDPEARVDRPGGGGFGLLSVREQIARLGGTLAIESAPQQGTRVTVRVPLQAEQGAGDP